MLWGEGKTVRVIAGEVLGVTSPVRTSSPMFYADVELEAGASLPLDPIHEERAIYTVSGAIEVDGACFGAGQLLVFRPGDRITVRARGPARSMILGGEPIVVAGMPFGTPGATNMVRIAFVTSGHAAKA